MDSPKQKKQSAAEEYTIRTVVGICAGEPYFSLEFKSLRRTVAGDERMRCQIYSLLIEFYVEQATYPKQPQRRSLGRRRTVVSCNAIELNGAYRKCSCDSWVRRFHKPENVRPSFDAFHEMLYCPRVVARAGDPSYSQWESFYAAIDILAEYRSARGRKLVSESLADLMIASMITSFGILKNS